MGLLSRDLAALQLQQKREMTIKRKEPHREREINKHHLHTVRFGTLIPPSEDHVAL